MTSFAFVGRANRPGEPWPDWPVYIQCQCGYRFEHWSMLHFQCPMCGYYESYRFGGKNLDVHVLAERGRPTLPDDRILHDSRSCEDGSGSHLSAVQKYEQSRDVAGAKSWQDLPAVRQLLQGLRRFAWAG